MNAFAMIVRCAERQSFDTQKPTEAQTRAPEAPTQGLVVAVSDHGIEGAAALAAAEVATVGYYDCCG